jgi:CubicO group peptidase (beta-lactamase class C family)
MKKSIGIILFVMISALVVGQTKDLDKKLSGLDTYIEQVRKDWKVQGLAVAIVQKNKVIYSKGFGYRDAEKKLPATAETQFAIGSCTKAFTAAGICLLQEDGKLELDKPVRNYLPGFVLHDSYATENLTPRDLLSHRSGLPRHDYLWYGSSLSRNELFDRLKYLEPNKTFREVYQYQNLMFMTAGFLVEQVSGQSWEQFTRDHLLVPLQMTSTNFSVSDLAKSENRSLGYMELNNKIEAVPYRNIDAMGPAGSINSSVKDMSNWVVTMINGGKFNGKKILSESTIRHLQSPVTTTPVAQVPPQYSENSYGSYALAWAVNSYRGHIRVEHGGNIDGFSASTCFMPQDSIGVVVLTNMNGTAVPSILRNTILDRMLGLSSVDWSGRLLAEVQKAKEAEQKRKKAINESRVKDTSPSHPLNEYIGIFEHPGYGELEIRMDGDSLLFDLHSLTTRLRHYHYDVFVGAGPRYFMGEKFSFLTNLQGEINQVNVALEPAVPEIVFRRKLVGKEVDGAVLASYVGEYDFGGQIAKVYLKGEKTLMMFVPGQPEYELVAVQKHEFKIKSLEGFKVKFSLENGKVTELKSIQPNGTFSARRK